MTEPEKSGRVTVRVSQREVSPGKRVPLGLLRWAARLAVEAAGCPEPVEVSLTLTGDGPIRELNRRFRGVNEPTDVLAFPLREGGGPPPPRGTPRPLGDVVISVDTARRQARQNGISPEREIARLVSHGVLHLLGFDHGTPQEERRMRAREARVRESLEGAGMLV